MHAEHGPEPDCYVLLARLRTAVEAAEVLACEQLRGIVTLMVGLIRTLRAGSPIIIRDLSVDWATSTVTVNRSSINYDAGRSAVGHHTKMQASGRPLARGAQTQQQPLVHTSQLLCDYAQSLGSLRSQVRA